MQDLDATPALYFFSLLDRYCNIEFYRSIFFTIYQR